MPRQDPSTRRYVPSELWSKSLNLDDLECHIAGLDFVLGRCDACEGCTCVFRISEMICCSKCRICERCLEPYPHPDSIIIATDGACRNNGTDYAFGGCGVFFGIDSKHNKAFQLDEPRTTSQRAELHAVIFALRKARNILGNGGFNRHISEVVVKTDSAYVVNSMVTWIIKWRNNGYTNARGLPLVNQDLFKEIDQLCDELAAIGIQARFWKVPRSWNEQADRLANAILDGVHWKSWRDWDIDDWYEDGPKPCVWD